MGRRLVRRIETPLVSYRYFARLYFVIQFFTEHVGRVFSKALEIFHTAKFRKPLHQLAAGVYE